MKYHFSLAFRIWLTAQLIYLVLNSVSLFFEPALLITSEMYAVCIGIPALIVFAFAFHLFATWVRQSGLLFSGTLFIAITITFVATLFAAYLFSPHRFWDAWLSNAVFPMAALISALVAVFIYSGAIRKAINPVVSEAPMYYTPD